MLRIDQKKLGPGKIRVAVYGSLKQGFANHGAIEKCSFVGTTTTQESIFDMISLGSFPAVVRKGKYKIHVEVYDINKYTLNLLDKIEDNGSFYERFPTKLDNNSTAWMYRVQDRYIQALNASKDEDSPLDLLAYEKVVFECDGVLSWEYKRDIPGILPAKEI